MGWSSATDIVIKTWKRLRTFIPENKRVSEFAKFIDVFRDEDYDCAYELEDEFPEAKAALKKLGELEEN